ncbi:MAG: 5'-nucleotidase C-terminal domain-containing protein [Bacteroidota bacterium]
MKDRVKQSDFPWILANVDASNSVLSQPEPFVTLSVGGFKVTFLGVVETRGKDGKIPATHPLRVADLTFQPHQDIVGNFSNLKAQEDADVLVGLTHLGSEDDRNLARNHTFFDVIIGGHSHERINEVVNGTPVLQADAGLELLGRIDFVIENKTVIDYTVSMINLQTATEVDTDLENAIAAYNDNPTFAQVVGQSDVDHFSFDVGCFYTTALKEFMEVDFTIQNLGGVRSGINQGPITLFEIYTMDPFNNGSVVFTKTVGEYESIFCESGSRFFYSGINISAGNGDIQIVDENGIPLPDDQELTMGVNDFIPAVFDNLFDIREAEVRDYTTAEAIIGYLENINSTIDFEGCMRVIACD